MCTRITWLEKNYECNVWYQNSRGILFLVDKLGLTSSKRMGKKEKFTITKSSPVYFLTGPVFPRKFIFFFNSYLKLITVLTPVFHLPSFTFQSTNPFFRRATFQVRSLMLISSWTLALIFVRNVSSSGTVCRPSVRFAIGIA